ncbi:MAG TPA: cytochrome c/FTR1 family iron permease [Rhizomicrobium sp.]|nr:cytochrome c/FTR1 family iron permease [Rhizomicrobium sp.]
MRYFLVSFIALLLLAQASLVGAQEPRPSAEVAWRLLDYIAVDYAGAVANGRIISEAEYREMVEFSISVRTTIIGLPYSREQPRLLSETDRLIRAVSSRADPIRVAEQARALGALLLKSYPVALAPRQPPNLDQGATLYAQHCSGCHGVSGRADGPNNAKLDPPAIAFTDESRARERSLFGLFQVITQGLDRTAMASFSQLSSDDRWALAFYVGTFAYPESLARRGSEMWQSQRAIRAEVPSLEALVQATPASLEARMGGPQGSSTTAYLRRHPEALVRSNTDLTVARRNLSASFTAYQAGDQNRAKDLALSAYLDGFEPSEAILRVRNGRLLAEIETAMGELRASISSGAPSGEVASQVDTLQGLLDRADTALQPDQASNTSSFLGAFAILLREGVEALLIVIAMIAFLQKAERSDTLIYVHAGWVGALVAGAFTWAAATYFISISGASRELTEGVGSLLSAAVLVSVGIWMHGKAQAGAWHAYIRNRLAAVLSKRSAWFLALLSFTVVYREVFETILFYAALWTQGNELALLSGAGVAVACLGVIAYGLLRFSRHLPIAQFFSYSSILIAILAVVLAGKGVAGLQEAGIVDIHPFAQLPRIDVLGLFPTWETFFAQLMASIVILVGFWVVMRPKVS